MESRDSEKEDEQTAHHTKCAPGGKSFSRSTGSTGRQPTLGEQQPIKLLL